MFVLDLGGYGLGLLHPGLPYGFVLHRDCRPEGSYPISTVVHTAAHQGAPAGEQDEEAPTQETTLTY